MALLTFKRADDPFRGEVVIPESISRFKYMYICTLVLNLWCTRMFTYTFPFSPSHNDLYEIVSIAARVWGAQQQSSGVQITGQRIFRNTIATIIESGQSIGSHTIKMPNQFRTAAIYSVFTIILIISASFQSALVYAILNPVGFYKQRRIMFVLFLSRCPVSS